MKFKSLLKSIAPALGAAYGGPFSGIAGKMIANALGEPEPKNDNALVKMVRRALSDPELTLKLKQADQAFELKMKELDVDIFETEVADRSNARELFKVNIWPQIILSILFIAGYFVVLAIVFQALHGDEEVNKEVLVLASTLLGIFTGEIPRIMSFWFGSSAGSKDKTAKIALTAGG